ncbi:MAG: hypothetical protein OXB88_08330 [Bacteriovoracales bacterium]|nr:hypothetical protein [Bacteriovoracales bacterium]
MKYFFFGLVGTCLAAQYSLKDLEFLENEKNYGEFFQHAQDIRPTERGQLWQDMVKTMAHSFLQKNLSLGLYRQHEYKTISLLSTWPTLRGDLEFQQLRAKFGQAYFSGCFEKALEKNSKKNDKDKNDECLEHLHVYFNQGAKLPEESLAYLNLLKNRPRPLPHSTFTYVKSLLKDPKQAEYCHRPLVKSALFERLLKMRSLSLSNLKIWIKQHIDSSCFKNLATSLKKDLRSTNFTDAVFAFDLLYAGSHLSSIEKDVFLMRHYLEKTKKGARLNLAWNTLKSLSRDFERRKRVLEELKTLDPLPDQLFGEPPSSKKNVFIDHLVHHFPEYLNHYSKTCLLYLEGKKSFPNGNPTIHCHRFMEEASGKNWISSQKLISYQKAKIQ